jgi:predicted ATPase
VRGVTLLTTSNIAAAELYRDGLQRASSCPASHCWSALPRARARSAQDYRLRQLTQAEPICAAGRGAEAALARTGNG